MEFAHRWPIVANGVEAASVVIGLVQCRSYLSSHLVDALSATWRWKSGADEVSVEGTVMVPYRPDDAGDLIRQADRGLVVIAAGL